MTQHSHFFHDQSAKNDVFDREPFAKNLTRSLVLPNNSPGLIIGIEGTWGSGKSTLIGMIKCTLDESKKAIVIDFNP